MKASHIPLLWKDSLVRPFRFNPKTPKEEQGKAMFISVKARFIPGRDVFGFDSLLALPQDEPPRHLKAGKKDKAEALKEKIAKKKEWEKKNPPKVKIKPKVIVEQSAAVVEKPKPKLKPKEP